MSKIPIKKRANTGFVQTDKKTHEEWARLTLSKPAAAALMHTLASQVGKHNSVVASYGTLAELLGVSQMTIRRAVTVLTEGNWIQVNRIGGAGTSNVYTLNDRVVWAEARNGLRYSMFSANVLVSASEQPKQDLENQTPLRKLPRIGEFQLPSGDGLPPPSQPFLDGFEPDLPASGQDLPEDEELNAIGE